MNTTLKTRLVNKHDIAANWAKALNFVPLQGEIIVYDDRYTDSGGQVHIVSEKVLYKIGDGITPVNDLPFINEVYSYDINTTLSANDLNQYNTAVYIGNNYSGHMYLSLVSKDLPLAEQMVGGKVDIRTISIYSSEPSFDSCLIESRHIYNNNDYCLINPDYKAWIVISYKDNCEIEIEGHKCTLPESGIYISRSLYYYDQTSDIELLQWGEHIVSKLDNKYLDLVNNEDFKALAENLGGESLNTAISTHNIDASAHADIRAQLENFVLNIDYEHLLAFDTNEVVISAASVAIIGQAMLGRMILA